MYPWLVAKLSVITTASYVVVALETQSIARYHCWIKIVVLLHNTNITISMN